MKYILISILALFLVACQKTTPEIVQEVKNGVVLITNEIPATNGEPEKAGLGTGFILQDNQIVTNLHVVEGGGKITVYSSNSEIKYEAIIVYKDEVADIAVLRLKEWESFVKNENPVNLVLGKSDNIKLGDKAVVIGHPWGLMWSVSEGIVSGKDRRNTQTPKFIDQIDAHLFQGNSGGPIFDENGNVICISNLMLSKEGGSYGFCIPSVLVSKVLYDFNKFDQIRWRVLNVAAAMSDDGSAVIFKSVEPNGAAGVAGIKDGDIVLKIYTPNNHPEGVNITSPDRLITELAKMRGDDETVKLLIKRNEELITIDVKTNYKLSSEYNVK